MRKEEKGGNTQWAQFSRFFFSKFDFFLFSRKFTKFQQKIGVVWDEMGRLLGRHFEFSYFFSIFFKIYPFYSGLFMSTDALYFAVAEVVRTVLAQQKSIQNAVYSNKYKVPWKTIFLLRRFVQSSKFRIIKFLEIPGFRYAKFQGICMRILDRNSRKLVNFCCISWFFRIFI